ncbi:MAG: anti-sigma factor family protein [Bacillota bacterium]
MVDVMCCEENVSAYLDGELPPEEVLAFEQHLRSCARCRESLNQLQALSGAVQALPRPSVNPWLTAQIMDRLQASQTVSDLPLTRLLRSWGLLSLLAFGALFVLFGPVILGFFSVVVKDFFLLASLVVKISRQVPPGAVNGVTGLALLAGALVAFYGFGRIYATLSQEELIS